DLTMPPGAAKGLEAEIPKPPAFHGARFASVEAALRDGPKFFAELMAAVGSHDGRDVVLVLEALRDQGHLHRDSGDGRYGLVKCTIDILDPRFCARACHSPRKRGIP